MNKNYKICVKLNYDQETAEKKSRIIELQDFIHRVMQNHGWRESEPNDNVIDYVFSIGGDGTMLHTMQSHVQTRSVVVGINAGNVGFLTPYNIENVFDLSVFKFLDDSFTPRIEDRSILQNSFKNSCDSSLAVNEYSFYASNVNDILDYSIEVEYKGHASPAGHYRANTLLISGPCGSTAYNMNAGGAIVDPTVRCMQIMMIAPTILGIRPLIIGRNSTINIRFKNDVKVFIDGMPYREIKASESEVFSINLLLEESKVMLPNDFNFYSMLSQKLHWNNGSGV